MSEDDIRFKQELDSAVKLRDRRRIKELVEERPDDSDALYQMGVWHLNTFPIDYKKAEKYLKLSVKQNNKLAMNDLADLYSFRGGTLQGVPLNPRKAFQLYLKLYSDSDLNDEYDVSRKIVDVLRRSKRFRHQLLDEYIDLKKKVPLLEKEVKLLQAKIDYAPGGQGYLEAKEEFHSLYHKHSYKIIPENR